MRRIFFTALASLAAYAVAAAGRAEYTLLQGNRDRAAQLGPTVGRAAVESSYAALQGGRLTAAEQLALQAIARSPVNLNAVGMLASVRERQGRLAEADKLFAAAGASWRVPAAQYALMQKAYERDDASGALVHADAMLRQELYEEELFPFVRQAAQFSNWRGALIQRLSERPNWRRKFMIQLRGLKNSDYEAHHELLTAMRRAGVSPDAEEIVAFTKHLVAEKEYARAWNFWKEFGRASSGFAAAAPNTNESESTPFDWTFRSQPGSSFSLIDERADSGALGSRLSVEGTVAGLALHRLVVLPPGSYTFRAVVTEDPKGSSASFLWRARCELDKKNLVDGRPTFDGGDGVILFTMRLNVTSSCSAQRLELWLDHQGPTSAAIILMRDELKPRR